MKLGNDYILKWLLLAKFDPLICSFVENPLAKNVIESCLVQILSLLNLILKRA